MEETLKEITNKLPEFVRVYEYTYPPNRTNSRICAPCPDMPHMIAIESLPPYKDGYTRRNICIMNVNRNKSKHEITSLVLQKAKEVLAYRD